MAKAKKKAATKTKPAPDAVIKVRVDPATKKRYDALVAIVKTANVKEASGFDAKWEAVREIVDRRLYVVGGYDDPDVWLRATTEESPRQARRFMRVAQYASPDDEARYTVTKLDAAIGYVAVKVGIPPHGSLPVRFDRLRIPVSRGGGPQQVSLDEATVDEIAAATRAIAREKGKARGHASPVADAFVASLAKTKELRGVAVHFLDGHVTFAHVPMAAFERFVASVRSTDWRGALKKANAVSGKKK